MVSQSSSKRSSKAPAKEAKAAASGITTVHIIACSLVVLVVLLFLIYLIFPPRGIVKVNEMTTILVPHLSLFLAASALSLMAAISYQRGRIGLTKNYKTGVAMMYASIATESLGYGLGGFLFVAGCVFGGCSKLTPIFYGIGALALIPLLISIQAQVRALKEDRRGFRRSLIAAFILFVGPLLCYYLAL